MKKTLFALATAALAVTMAFGLAACGAKPAADDSVTTEDQWKKAFEDSSTAQNIVAESSEDDTDSTGAYEMHMKGTYSIDFVNFKASSIGEMSRKMSYDGKEESASQTNQYYIEADGTKYYNYLYVTGTGNANEDGKWNASSVDLVTAEAAQLEFKSDASMTVIHMFCLADTYSATVNGTALMGSLHDLFKAFTYDESTHVYSAELTQVGATYKFEVSFNGGKVLSISYTSTKGTTTAKQTTTFTYGNASVSVPKEAKDALPAA